MCMYVCAYVCVCVCVCMGSCVYFNGMYDVCACMCMYACVVEAQTLYVRRAYACVCVCMYVRMHAHAYADTFMIKKSTHMHTSSPTHMHTSSQVKTSEVNLVKHIKEDKYGHIHMGQRRRIWCCSTFMIQKSTHMHHSPAHIFAGQNFRGQTGQTYQGR